MYIIDHYKNLYDNQKALKIYGDYYRKNGQVLYNILSYYKNKKGYRVAIWGGGLKGKAFLQIFDKNNELVRYIYDINKDLWNSKMNTGHHIVDYRDQKYQDIDVVFIMNNNFETEIAGMLKEADMHVILVNIDSIICGNMSYRESLVMYKGRL
jgi:hypothetical protein